MEVREIEILKDTHTYNYFKLQFIAQLHFITSINILILKPQLL